MIYKIGHRKRKTLELHNKNDIDQLNILQILNCFTTVFFNEKVSKHYIETLIIKSKKYKKANVPNSQLSHIIKNGERNQIDFSKKTKNLVILGSSDCEIKLNINGIKIHSNAIKVKLTKAMAQIRPRPLALKRNSS